MTAVVLVRDLAHRYGVAAALALPSLELAANESCLVVGASGSGKSTLLHVLAGLVRPTRGSVQIDGQDLAALSGPALDHFRGRTIGFVPQRLHLLASLDVRANLQLARYLAGLPVDDDRIDEVLESLGMLDKASAFPGELSHGQAQRAAVARAVVNSPKVILADEPTANLDDGSCAQTIRLIEDQAQRCAAALIVATHDQRIRDRIGRQVLLEAPR
jgi:putative ABC transport system ATP-binding protein